MASGPPYPDCQDCKGSGQIHLFTSVEDCDACKKRVINEALGRANAVIDKCNKAVVRLSESFDKASEQLKAFIKALKIVYDRDMAHNELRGICDFYNEHGSATVEHDPDQPDRIRVKRDE